MVEPKKATAAIILCEGPPMRILMARRNDDLRFMPGHHVFPGGRIDDDEGVAHVVGAESEEHARQLHAVAREILEETGILATHGPDLDPEALRAARRQVLDDPRTFDDVLDRFGQTIDASDFVPAGHWITPPLQPIRFDTQYFVYRVPQSCGEELISGEHVSLDWLEPSEARRRWREGALTLPAPVAYTLREMSRAPYPDMLPALCRTSDPRPGVPGRIEFQCGVQIIPLRTHTLPPATHTNCIIVGEDELIIIDPGPVDTDEQAVLSQYLDQFVEMGSRIAAVVLTHGHPDHTGAVTMIQERYGVPVWAHAETAERVHFAIDRHLDEGEILVVRGDPDWRLRCLHTPGHDPGHLCFFEETTSTVLGGDMVANPGTIVVSPENRGDMTHFLNSLERLRNLEHKMLIPSHGMPMFKPQQKLQETIDHRLWREARVQEAVDRGLATLDELLAAVYDDVPEQAWPLARHSLKAHLLRLGVDVPD